ncbi:MAG: hypothetical protein GTO18_08220 [Anaerolineales bacterium]|nr:hypothetical protein [Anaerolineales bacterium]
MSDELTFWLAVYGAGLSTLIVFLSVIRSILNRRRFARRLIIRCAMGTTGFTESTTIRCVDVNVVNTGQVPVRVDSVALKLRDGQHLVVGKHWKGFKHLRSSAVDLGEQELPRLLDCGADVTAKFDWISLRQAFERAGIKASVASIIVHDAKGKRYTSSVPIFLDKMLREKG